MTEKTQRQEIIPANTQEQSNALISMIERVVSNPDMDVQKLEKLLDMQERILAKSAEMAFNNAMNQAQSETGRIAADSENIHTQSLYASYAALDRVLRPIYTKHGFSLSFDTGESPENTVKVLCYVSHNAGYTRTYKVPMPADGKGAKGGDVMTKTHAAGSAMQYGQRYLLKLIFNVAVGKDDDGNDAGTEYISENQAADLNILLDDVGANKEAFCAFFKIPSVDKLSVQALEHATAMIEAKRDKKEKK